jgi:hypothetical protein
VADIGIEDVPIEDVIGRLFSQGAAAPQPIEAAAS